MPSPVRRRSQDPRLDSKINNEQNNIQQSFPTRHAKVNSCLAIVLIFLLAVVSLSWYIWSSGERLLPDDQLVSSNQPTAWAESSLLHPHDHINRAPQTQHHQWRITERKRRPDGVLKSVYCINGLFPGPTLETRPGDCLIIEVENGLDNEATSIHWHGLSMRGANDMDGSVGITQNAIPPGDTHVYNFTIDKSQHGTFWYHAHSQVQRADGLYGGLVVHELASKDSDSDERLLLMGDWYHRAADEALHFYMHPGSFGNEPVPDSILLNGRGVFNCDDAVPARPLDCVQQDRNDVPILLLDGRRQSMLRIVNVGSYAGIALNMPGALLTPFQVDGGHKIETTSVTEIGFLHPGERVDVLVEHAGTKSAAKDSLELSLDTSIFKYPNPALTPAHRFPVVWQGARHSRLFPSKAMRDRFDLAGAISMKDQSTLIPQVADHVIVLYAITQKLAHLKNEPRGFINNTYWKPQSKPNQPLVSLNRDLWDEHQFVPQVKYSQESPEWFDIVLNNLDEEGHPFHLHGHDFWVLSTYSSTYNWGSYNPFEDEEAPGGGYNLESAIKKDTIEVPRRGYAVLRVRADNPGIWMFHCHNLWHQASGMAMAFEVG